jgi:hypothetical protein
VARNGHWSHERERDASGALHTGIVMLDPIDVVFPVEHWRVEHAPRARTLHVERIETNERFAMSRTSIDSLARPFVAHWRFVGPSGATAPQELVLHSDGALELIPRAGASRATGRWSLQHPRRGADAFEATLVLSTHVPGHAPTREQWNARLPFASGAELQLAVARGVVAKYRRLFR